MLGAYIGQVHLTAPSRELARHKSDLEDVWDVRWDKWGAVRAGDYIFFSMKKNESYQLETGFFVHHRIISAVKRE